MRLLIDTNILLYAANRAGREFQRAKQYLDRHLKSRVPWCLTWPVIYEFLRVSTHPRVFPRPLSAEEALRFLEPLLRSPSLTLLVPTERHHELLKETLREVATPAGNIFHDIATAVTLREHGVSEIVTADTDFHQFKFLKVINPLLEGA